MTAPPSLNRKIKRAAKRALHSLLRRAEPKSAADPKVENRILTYHSIGVRTHEMNVTPAAFRGQMEWLAETQTVISVEDAAQGRPGIAISFDDGYADNLLNAVPILNEFGFVATVYVVAGRAGGLLDHDTGDRAARLMTWEEIRKLEALGMSIGAHTLNHRRLTSLSHEDKREEILGSCALLEKELGHAVDGFAYPYGSLLDYDAASKRLVREAGCTYALSNRYGANGAHADRFALRRINIDGTDTLESFQAKIDGRLDRIALLDSRMGARVRRTLNVLIGT